MKEILSESQIYRNLYQYDLTEEVEIATEYFYSEGINEFGIDLLIDDLGLDQFAEFVYEIAEEYTLTEARAAKRRKGGPSVEEVKAKIDAKEAAKKKAAVKSAAAKQQPTRSETPAQAKQGIGSKIGAALKFAADRAKKDTELLKKSYQTAREVGKGHEARVAKVAGTVAGATVGAAKAAHKAGQEFGKSETGQKIKAGLEKTAKATAAAAGAGAGSLASGKSAAASAGRAAGTFVRKMRAEGYDDFDIILEYLIAEDYAETNEAAIAIMANMSEEWRENIIEATAMTKRGYDETAIRNKIAKSTGGGKSADRATKLADKQTYGQRGVNTQARQNLARAQRGDFRNTTSSNPGLHGYTYKTNDPDVQAKQAARGAQRGVLTPSEKKKLGR